MNTSIPHKMQTDELIFSLFYVLIGISILYPPAEFVSAGFTIERIFKRQLGSENERFIHYHLRRTIWTAIIHSLLPIIYLFILYLFFDAKAKMIAAMSSNQIFFLTVLKISIFIPCFTLYKVISWTVCNWKYHPVCRNLIKFNQNRIPHWSYVADDINIEFRRVDKLCIRTNSVVRVIATDNWIVQVTPYMVYVAHQSDTTLVVKSSDTHKMTHYNRGEIQFINIDVKSTRPGVEPFVIRMNALDFRELQDKFTRPIVILPNVTFHKTLIERFIDAFKDQVNLNATYETNQELEPCIGCMQLRSNVKLQKLCVDDTEDEPGQNCTNCYCRPMWCIDCMARWFASRQDESRPETWLTCKCTCPVCRARFCIYDVSLIRS